MKTLYLECKMGASGDMLTAALLELVPDADAFIARLNALDIPGVAFSAAPAEKCGIRGTAVTVTGFGVEEGEEYDELHEHEYTIEEDEHHDHHEHHHVHEHHTLADIQELVCSLDMPEAVKDDVLAVYALIADAESQVHGTTVEQVHFHELGALDAVADVTAVCLLLHEIGPDRIVASPVQVGDGFVRCAHGVLPVPAPATELLLRGIPTAGGAAEAELCTPTGAALLRHFVSEWGERPAMTVEKTGVGCGKKGFARANVLRAMLGMTFGGVVERVAEMRCSLDDMTGEDVAFAVARLLEQGALDAYTIPVTMKKGRPGVLLICLCREEDEQRLAETIFTHTTTLGIRTAVCTRRTLKRETVFVPVPGGEVRIKLSSGFGVQREKMEYDDLAALALREGVSLARAREIAEEARAEQ